MINKERWWNINVRQATDFVEKAKEFFFAWGVGGEGFSMSDKLCAYMTLFSNLTAGSQKIQLLS